MWPSLAPLKNIDNKPAYPPPSAQSLSDYDATWSLIDFLINQSINQSISCWAIIFLTSFWSGLHIKIHKIINMRLKTFPFVKLIKITNLATFTKFIYLYRLKNYRLILINIYFCFNFKIFICGFNWSTKQRFDSEPHDFFLIKCFKWIKKSNFCVKFRIVKITNIYLYNKTRHSYIYMSPIGGQTAGPNGQEVCVTWI